MKRPQTPGPRSAANGVVSCWTASVDALQYREAACAVLPADSRDTRWSTKDDFTIIEETA